MVLRKRALLDLVTRSILECRWNVLYLESPDNHPFRLQVYRDDESYRVRIYIWNLTHGGGSARPRSEYRIQITGLSTSYFEPEIGGKTLILGWWDEVGVFAGFDYNKHSGTLGSSPSIQIREQFLRNAHINGFSACDKGNEEIAIAFKPSFFIEYIKNLESLHGFGESEYDLSVLETVAENPYAVNDGEIESTSWTRQTVIQSVKKRLRDSSFQDRVLTAYNYRCAMCGVQLDLVQAAHIVPVSHENGTDETSNGIALCALHHYAYDRGLVFVDEDYSIELNQSKLDKLRVISRDEGLEEFTEALRAIILLPPATSDRPHRDYLSIANFLRLAAS
ncbi:HNH endonuclease [Thermoleptolyngbya sp. C42_A2020_037]|uniref:HNH endonuclease n=1 Tax=Thermoleptolyngbya sp. C42_A2020_037 TaxID=2747799 RepID=UPI001A0CBC40|nr:HNH endonuclease [Thermoleptolyngbya sp. C42_A2020_037]MBF2085322.1 HNH endonuclease [Thermoleptolyngbya sp. C42_A2020_037]